MPKNRTTRNERDVMVRPDGVGGWLVFLGRRDSPVTTHRTEADAMDFGRVLARSAEANLLVYGPDGAVKYSERRDPRTP